MPLLGNDKIEDCPICYHAFSKEDIIYRPLLEGRVGKPYHKKCLEELCDNSGEPCVDPVTTIKFNISSKIKCNYSRPYRITLHAEDELILLGTEPCDRFYDIKSFISLQYKIPMDTITLWKIGGNERTPIVESELIGDDVDLELSLRSNVDDIPFADLYDDDYDDYAKKKIEKIVKELEKLESLEKKEHLSSDEITIAAQKAVEVSKDSKDSKDSKEDSSSSEDNSIDFEIRESNERLEKINQALSTLSRNDPARAQLETSQTDEKTRYQKLLIKGILTLFENVKDVLSQFLSRSGDFATDPETHAQLHQFVSYVLRLLATGMYSVLRLIAVLGWEICKLIPRIIKYGLSEKNEKNEDYPYPEDDPLREEDDTKQGFFSSFFSKGDDAPPEDDPIGVFHANEKIRQREAPNIRFLRESGVDVSGPGFQGLRKDEVFRKGFLFGNKKSKRMRKQRKIRK
jgi:hypothetical protein